MINLEIKNENTKLLEIATKIVQTAGKKLSDKKTDSLVLKSQLKHDIKLNEDSETEEFIKNRLIKLTSIPILGEEHKAKPEFTNEKIWILDPIDGTVNFSRGIPIASVSLALWDKKKPIFGIIYDIFNNITYTGMVGVGAYKNGRTIEVSKRKFKKDSILLTGLPAASELKKETINTWFTYFTDFQKVRLIGSASISLCYVGSGLADAYIEKDIQIWDVAAGLAIVKAAGGRIEYHKSSSTKYSYLVKAGNGKFTF